MYALLLLVLETVSMLAEVWIRLLLRYSTPPPVVPPAILPHPLNLPRHPNAVEENDTPPIPPLDHLDLPVPIPNPYYIRPPSPPVFSPHPILPHYLNTVEEDDTTDLDIHFAIAPSTPHSAIFAPPV
ncbi:Protein of unknown function [Pyronema omphalodes CBS 100304]|uniref:Uncharacterized protein n=1 Tax=Pyronema omphalodes (strain CBS 100304) TaxID=1076935 RepID=U4LU35_PYROM|nr:Protein of unknown function [Pyronema omphalodes CBS 100304]